MGQSQELLGLLLLSLFACCINLVPDASVSRVVLSFAALGILRNEMGFDEVVELVQVDIAEDRRNNASLRCPTQRCVVAPFLKIASLKYVFDQAQETVIVDVCSQPVSLRGPDDPIDRNRL